MNLIVVPLVVLVVAPCPAEQPPTVRRRFLREVLSEAAAKLLATSAATLASLFPHWR
jgi:hypothetical protein